MGSSENNQIFVHRLHKEMSSQGAEDDSAVMPTALIFILAIGTPVKKRPETLDKN